MSLVMPPEVAEALSRLVEKWRGEVATYPDDLMGWSAAVGVLCCADELEDRLDSVTVQRKRWALDRALKVGAIDDGAWRAGRAALAEPDEAEAEATDV